MYKCSLSNLLEKPITYQFSDVSASNYILEYKKQRKTFLKNTESKLEPDYFVFIKNIQLLDYQSLIKLQKKFEVKKSFFENYEKNFSFIVMYSYNLSLYLENNFCLSLLSTLLKVNDTLTSLEENKFSIFEINLLANSIEKELDYIERLESV